jgi:hypothetical protein
MFPNWRKNKGQSGSENQMQFKPWLHEEELLCEKCWFFIYIRIICNVAIWFNCRFHALGLGHCGALILLYDKLVSEINSTEQTSSEASTQLWEPLPSATWIQSTSSPPSLLKIHLNIILWSVPRTLSWSLFFYPKFLCVSCCSLLFYISHSLACLITLIIFGEGYESWSFSLCSFLQLVLLPPS